MKRGAQRIGQLGAGIDALLPPLSVCLWGQEGGSPCPFLLTPPAQTMSNCKQRSVCWIVLVSSSRDAQTEAIDSMAGSVQLAWVPLCFAPPHLPKPVQKMGGWVLHFTCPPSLAPCPGYSAKQRVKSPPLGGGGGQGTGPPVTEGMFCQLETGPQSSPDGDFSVKDFPPSHGTYLHIISASQESLRLGYVGVPPSPQTP